MSYYPTIDEDLQRARNLLAKGAQVPGHGGIIHGVMDVFLAYMLLDSFVAEIERLQEDLVELAVTSHRTEQRLRAEVSSPASQLSISEADALIEGLKDVAAGRIVPVPAAEVSSPASQLDLELRAIAGHLCNMEKEFPSTCKAIRQCIARLEPHDD